jgi:hypothetical protein
MERSPILNPQGTPVFLFRGLVISLEWVKGGRRKNPPRAMCIWRERSPLIVNANENAERGTYVINQRAITNYIEFNGNDKCTGGFNKHMLPECVEALPILGFDRNDRQALLALIDCIIKFGPELMVMPPAGARIRNALADVPLMDVSAIHVPVGYQRVADGRVISEGEV